MTNPEILKRHQGPSEVKTVETYRTKFITEMKAFLRRTEPEPENYKEKENKENAKDPEVEQETQ